MKGRLSTLMGGISALCVVIVFLVPELAVLFWAHYALVALLAATAIVFFVEGVKYKMAAKIFYGAVWTAFVVLLALQIW